MLLGHRGSVPAGAGRRQCSWEGAGLRTGTLDPRPPRAELPKAAPRMASLGPWEGQEAGLCQFRDHWPRPGPGTGAGGRGDKGRGEPHRVADLSLRLGRQPSGPPEPVWGFWKLQFPRSHPANQALSTGKYWEPPLPLAGVGQSSPALVTRSRKFSWKQHGESGQ